MSRERYAVNAQAAVASPTVSLLGLTSGTTVRPEIYEIIVGASGTPADNALSWFLQRYTAAGTNTGNTPALLDSGGIAARTTGAKTFTGEPTYTSALILWKLALNQRASHRWVADPDGRLKIPATASNGAGLYPVHASYTGNADALMYFEE